MFFKVTLCKYPTVVGILCHIIYCIRVCVHVVPSMFCLCVPGPEGLFRGAHIRAAVQPGHVCPHQLDWARRLGLILHLPGLDRGGQPPGT